MVREFGLYSQVIKSVVNNNSSFQTDTKTYNVRKGLKTVQILKKRLTIQSIKNNSSNDNSKFYLL